MMNALPHEFIPRLGDFLTSEKNTLCASAPVLNSRLEDSRCKIDPQRGANRILRVVDIRGVGEGAVGAYIRLSVLIAAGRPQPPQPGGLTICRLIAV